LCDDAVTKLQRINANVKTQSDLIADLMELSRIRSKPPKHELVDLQALVKGLRDELSYDLETNGIDLAILGVLPTITADRNRMRQIFQNLLDNAVKYMGDSDERKITVKFTREADELHFVVADTGQGIHEKDLPNIFDVFRRGTYSGSYEVPGRGVGLASVKTIVECYGGRVWLESRRGEGSTLHFTLAVSMCLPAAALAV